MDFLCEYFLSFLILLGSSADSQIKSDVNSLTLFLQGFTTVFIKSSLRFLIKLAWSIWYSFSSPYLPFFTHSKILLTYLNNNYNSKIHYRIRIWRKGLVQLLFVLFQCNFQYLSGFWKCYSWFQFPPIIINLAYIFCSHDFRR